MSQRNAPETSSPFDPNDAYTKVLGYLNFSNGKSDVDFLGQLNRLASHCGIETSWEPLRDSLDKQLAQLAGESPAFSDAAQASAALQITFDSLLPAYQEFHSDLLFHLQPSDFVNPLFLGRCFEAVLEQGGPWDEVERVVKGALDRLNDYLGYRPVPVLENGRKMMPYDHERFRPLPLYIEGAGVTDGDHKPIIEKALEMLNAAPSDVLIGAHFDLANLSELDLDGGAERGEGIDCELHRGTLGDDHVVQHGLADDR